MKSNIRLSPPWVYPSVASLELFRFQVVSSFSFVSQWMLSSNACVIYSKLPDGCIFSAPSFNPLPFSMSRPPPSLLSFADLSESLSNRINLRTKFHPFLVKKFCRKTVWSVWSHSLASSLTTFLSEKCRPTRARSFMYFPVCSFRDWILVLQLKLQNVQYGVRFSYVHHVYHSCHWQCLLRGADGMSHRKWRETKQQLIW